MNQVKQDNRKLLFSFYIPLALVVIMWGVFATEWILGTDFNYLGILPRKISGLSGVLLAPFLHGDIGHLTSNTFPFLFLLTGVFYFYRKIAWPVLFTSWIITGVWVWIGARSSYHIGASGVVYALIFFLFFSGVFRKEVRAIAISLIVAFLYGSAVWGVLPVQDGVSWESHLFGAIVGTITAFYYRNSGPGRKKYEWEDYEDHDDPTDAYQPWNYKSLFQPPEGFKYPEE